MMTMNEVFTALTRHMKGDWKIEEDRLVLKVQPKGLENLNYVPMVVTLTPEDLHCHLRTFGLAKFTEAEYGKAVAYCNQLNMAPWSSVQFFVSDDNSIDMHYGFLMLDDDAWITICGGGQIARAAKEVDRAYGALQKVLNK